MKMIKLTQGRHAIVDDDVHEELSRFSWWFGNGGYAQRTEKRRGEKRNVMMHHHVLPRLPEFQIDHINGNKLDNRRSNLRYATASENHINKGLIRSNTSGFTGVSWRANRGRWKAYFKKNGRQIYVGQFKTREEAARARDAAVRDAFGEFSRDTFYAHSDQ
jgi:hypothetical protein